MPEIETGKVHLHYDDLGSGPAVLFSHSWFCDGRQWPQVDAVVEVGHRVLNLDNRGHSRSGPHRDPFTMWDMAEDLVAVLDDAGVDDAVLVGLSIGGFASLRAALSHPDRVRGLVLADTSAGPAAWSGRAKTATLGSLWGTRLSSLAERAAEKVLFGRTARREQPGLVAEWRERFLAQDPDSILVSLKAVLSRDDVTPRLGEIAVPTLVVVGEEDRDPGVLSSVALVARIPGAGFVALPGTGHLSALEQPDLFARALLDFLASLPTSETPSPAGSSSQEDPTQRRRS